MEKRILATVISVLSASPSLADHSELPEVVVTGRYSTIDFSYTRNSEQLQHPDSSALLSTIPGANINRNGPLTGIVQYRGAYGNRVNVTIDGEKFISGGPNAMDTPLSYVPGGLLNELRVSRGIASVSDGQETLGGHVAVTSHRGDFALGQAFETHATLKSGYTSTDKGSSNSVFVYTANSSHKLGANISYDHGSDGRYDGSDTIENTFYERNRYNLFYDYQRGDSGLELSIGRNETDDSGTPALPMDILYVDSDLARASAYTLVGNTKISTSISYSHADHGMDNLSHRTPPTMTMMMHSGGMGMSMPMSMPMNRYAHATGRKLDYKLQLETPLAGGTLTLGADNHQTVHDTVITDPTMAMFKVHNFNDTEKTITGLFGEWEVSGEQWTLEAGLRHNQVDTDAGAVSAAGFSTMPMSMGGPSMADMVTMLANGFNSADRSDRDNNLDAVLKLAYHLSADITLGAALAQKTRSPSYQERYLWLPLETAGGLADGRNYIGNTELDSEVAHELNLGVDWKPGNSYLSLQAFYRDVEDYIQGTPSTSMSANMVANMMSGEDALQFNNVDAKLYGADLGYGWQINGRLRIDGTLSYVRGERTDISDDLYRIAPLNHRLAVSYAADHVILALESEIYAEQDKVSSYNGEEETGGYGLWHLRAQTDVGEHLSLSAGVENLFDRKHQNHLSGYNRVEGSDIATGARIYGPGRNAYLNVTYRW